MNQLGVFIVHYDYGTGSTYLCVIANSEEQVLSELNFVRIVDPAAKGLDPDYVKRLKGIARPLHDPFWDEIRRS